MNIGFIVSTILEVLFGGFIVWGIFNEDILIRFEDRIRNAVFHSHKSHPAPVARMLTDEPDQCA